MIKATTSPCPPRRSPGPYGTIVIRPGGTTSRQAEIRAAGGEAVSNSDSVTDLDAVKKMIKQAKKRGFVTFDQLNEVLPSDTTSPEQIEDIMSMLSDMGINVSENEDSDGEEENKEEADDETDNELVEVTQKAVTEVKKSEPGERTDDPVRMYLREIGTVELLSREGEIAIAKRIEAVRPIGIWRAAGGGGG
eukprot:gene28782-38044_t